MIYIKFYKLFFFITNGHTRFHKNTLSIFVILLIEKWNLVSVKTKVISGAVERVGAFR